MNSTQTFFVVGCLPFLDDLVGFALPILKTPARPHTEVVQYIDEYTGLISGFFEFERTSEQIVLQQNDFTVKGGDEHVLAFVTEDGFCHLGTATSLAPILRGFISRFPKRNAIALQVAELIGNAQEKKLARLSMREELVNSAGLPSARAFYEGAALRSAVWGNLVALAPNADVAKRILGARARLGASIGAGGELLLHLDALDDGDRALMNEELLKDAIISEFAIVPDMIAIPTPTYEKYDNVQESGVRDLLIEVRSARRQEERIAILIAGILENRSVGISALLQYGRDKAKFANHALDRIRDTLIRDDGDDRLMEIAAAKLVRHLYSAQFPASRGSLLLFFAKYLAGWPEINGEIHRRLGRTRSMFVEQYRPVIEEFLKSPRIQSRDGPDLPLFRASLQSFPIE